MRYGIASGGRRGDFARPETAACRLYSCTFPQAALRPNPCARHDLPALDEFPRHTFLLDNVHAQPLPIQFFTGTILPLCTFREAESREIARISNLRLIRAIGAKAGKDDVEALNLKAMGVAHAREQFLAEHLDVVDDAAFTADRVVVAIAAEVIAVGTPRHGDMEHLALLGQHVEVAVHRRPRDARVLLAHRVVHVC